MKKAFTMLELVFVIIITGILVAVIVPNFQKSNINEAASQLISHIRYTQHLAMLDNKFDVNDANWFKKRWQLVLDSSENTGGVPAYTIFSDTNKDSNANVSEMAVNLLDKTKRLSGGYSGTLATDDQEATRDMNIGQKYGISEYLLSGGCAGARVAFDYLGRPISGDVTSMTSSYVPANRLITTRCDIKISIEGGDSLTIGIEPETGYAHIL